MNILAGYVFCSSPRNLKNEDVVVEEKEKSDRIMPEIENNYDTIDTHNQSPGLAASETADSGIFNLIINYFNTKKLLEYQNAYVMYVYVKRLFILISS